MSVTDPDVEEINRQLARVAEACLDGRPLWLVRPFEKVTTAAVGAIADVRSIVAEYDMALRGVRDMSPEASAGRYAHACDQLDRLNKLLNIEIKPTDTSSGFRRTGRTPGGSVSDDIAFGPLEAALSIFSLVERVFAETDAQIRSALVGELTRKVRRLAPGTTRKGMSFAVHFHMPTVLGVYDVLVKILRRRNQDRPVLADIWDTNITIGPVAGRTIPSEAAYKLIATAAKRVRNEPCSWQAVRAAERAARAVPTDPPIATGPPAASEAPAAD